MSGKHGQPETPEPGSTFDAASASRVAEHVLAFLEARQPGWAWRPLAVLLFSAVFFLFLGQTYGSVLTIAYTSWVLWNWAKRFFVVLDLSRFMLPAVSVAPDGLADIAVTSAVFAEADIYKGLSRKRRLARLQNVARTWFTAEGPGLSYDCSAGHAQVCGHRASSGAREFWAIVAHSESRSEVPASLVAPGKP